jgi:hypothetical protein
MARLGVAQASNAHRVHGGGGLNTLLCEMMAGACGCPVVSSPVEASTIGNGDALSARLAGTCRVCESGVPSSPHRCNVPLFPPADRQDQVFKEVQVSPGPLHSRTVFSLERRDRNARNRLRRRSALVAVSTQQPSVACIPLRTRDARSSFRL